MSALFDVILPVFLVIGFGYVAVWRGFFSEENCDAVMGFAQKFALPALLFSAISQLDFSTELDLRLHLGFFTGAASCFFIGLFTAHYVFNRAWEDAVVIGFACLFSNGVLLGFSINERAYGIDQIDSAVSIIAFHAPFCYLLGITTMELTRSEEGLSFKLMRQVLNAMFHNALVLAICLGFVVNLLSLPLPNVVTDALGLIVRAALPAALFALGGILVGYRAQGDGRVIMMICLLSLGIHPLITVLISGGLEVPAELLNPVVMTAAMAPGVNAYLFANMYGVAKRVAASSVLLGTLFTMLTGSAWLYVLG